MTKEITLPETIVLLLSTESYILGANYALLQEDVDNYEYALQEIRARQDLFKVYPLDKGALILCDSQWLYSKYVEVDKETDYPDLYKMRVDQQKTKLGVLLHRYMKGQAETSLVEYNKGYIEIKLGIHTLKDVNQVKYRGRALYSFKLSLIEALNTILTVQEKVDIDIHIRTVSQQGVQYPRISTLLTGRGNKERLDYISKGLESLPTGVATVLTLRIPLESVDRKFNQTMFI